MVNNTPRPLPDAPSDTDGVSPEEELTIVSSAFAALGSETRLAIVLRLVRAGHSGIATGELGEAVGVTGSVLTHHLKHLKAAGLIYQEKDGRRIMWFADHDFVGDISHFMVKECCVDDQWVIKNG
ncbi:ArsR/SmtB family transcription factor [Gymnodinialimonas ulvae]|uniref:ArsR/SmtB family transcription factor n=1 Tax=Gymnodinialimonas ulvae TaxID=3126504 RepID=UPI0030EDBF06